MTSQHTDEMREAFDKNNGAQLFAENDLRENMFALFKQGYQAAEARYLPAIEKLVDEAVDVMLLNDAIMLITKSLAGMLTDTSFASPYAEDHRATTPRWVIAKFAHDYDRRVQYVNDIKQRLDWVRNATEKARKGKALDLAAPLLSAMPPNNPASLSPDILSSDGDAQIARMSLHAAPMRPWDGGDLSLLDPDMPDQELRLHMGELSGSEIAVARAAIRWANSKIAKPLQSNEGK